MPNAPAIQRLEARLFELGCPANRAELQVQEVADHYEDLRLQCLEEGLSEAEAERRANQLLGEPVELADHLAYVLRQSSWWGRHRFIGFCLLPPVGVFAASLLALCTTLGCLKLCFSANEWSILVDAGSEFQLIAFAVQTVSYLGIAVVAALFCWLARHSVAGWRWALAACAACSVQSYFSYCRVAPHRVSIGYALTPDWMAAGIPAVVALAALLLSQPSRKRPAAGVPELAPGSLPEGGLKPTRAWGIEACRRKAGFPTYCALTLVLAGTACLSIYQWRQVRAAAQSGDELLNRRWPAERARVEQLVRLHQQPQANTSMRMIDLEPCVNATLTEGVGYPALPRGTPAALCRNNLASLPRGIHTFADVPFRVAGRVQLMGRGFAGFGQVFPTRIRKIKVGQKCELIHILHGAAFVALAGADRGMKIGTLIVHYADGSRSELSIISGRDVLDWWGPIMSTGVPRERRELASPRTALAWVGTNSLLHALHPELSLRLYRSTFENPKPGLEVVSLDYVSTLSEAAPFLLGLTVE